MRALIIYNSFSGKNKITKKIDYINKRLKEKYNVIDVYESKYKNDIKNHILVYANNYNVIIIAGGDGSLNEAINGLVLLKSKPMLGYIPMGTCNDLGHSLGLKKKLAKTLDIILDNKVDKEYYLDFNIEEGEE